MPETETVGNFRRSTLLAIVATVLVVAAFVGMRFLPAAGPPVPTSVAVVTSPSPTVTAGVAATPASTRPPQTASPRVSPTLAPTTTPLPSRSPIPHPTDGLASAVVYSTADFERAFVSRQFLGVTMLVRGRIVATTPRWSGGPGEQARLICDSEPHCVYGELEGATINGGTRPLLVWSEVIDTPLGPDDRYDTYWWPSRTRVPLPIEGVLVLRIDTTYSVEFVGRALNDAAGPVWSLESVDAMDVSQVALEEVVVVDAGLAGSKGSPCPPTDHELPLPRGDCGDPSWLESTTPGASWAVPVQYGAYGEFSSGLSPRSGQPTYALWAIGSRLALGGNCGDAACPGWHVVSGPVSDDVILGRIAGLPTPSPIPTDGWIAVPETSVSTTWSPDGRWLLDWRGDTIFLIDARTGAERRSWRYVEDEWSRGPLWLDETTFVAAPMPTSADQVHRGLAPAKLGRVGSAHLVDIEVPVGYEDGDLIVAGVAGHGAIAFLTTKEGDLCPNYGCWRYRIWTPEGISRQRTGMPITWSSSGDRLAVIHNDDQARGNSRGAGAGWGGYSGWLEVVRWPSLQTVLADRAVIAHEDATFDPTGRRLLLGYWPEGWVDLRSGVAYETVAGQVLGDPSVWDAAGRLMGTDADGDVLAVDQNDSVVVRWSGAGHRVVGTADGRVQVAWLSDDARGTPFGVFTAIFQDGSTSTFELPAPPERAFLFVPSVLPDGRTLIVHVVDYGSGNSTLMLHPLAPPADR